MKRKDMNSKHEVFARALQGKQLPILTLDSKWYRLLNVELRAQASGMEKQLNELLKRQGKLNTEMKDVQKLKKQLMSEIVPLVTEADQNPSPALEKKIDQNKRLVEECNQKLAGYQAELEELPRKIEQLNIKLMLFTMDCCYEVMQENYQGIQQISKWVTEIRIELKKRLVKKQEMEQRNNVIYSYMHDVFGAEVVDMFDMQYNPEKQHPAKPKKGAQTKGKQKSTEDSMD